MGREENLQVFLDTEKQVKNNKILSETVKYSSSHQIAIPEYMSVSDMMSITNGTEEKSKKNADILNSRKKLMKQHQHIKGKKYVGRILFAT